MGHPLPLQAAWERTAMEAVRAAAQKIVTDFRSDSGNTKDELFAPTSQAGQVKADGELDCYDPNADAFSISSLIYADGAKSYLGDGYEISNVYPVEPGAAPGGGLVQSELAGAATKIDVSMYAYMAEYFTRYLIELDIVPIYVDRRRNFTQIFDKLSKSTEGMQEAETYVASHAGIVVDFDGNVIPCTFGASLSGWNCGSWGIDGGTLNEVWEIRKIA
jgi:hypothetical protein